MMKTHKEVYANCTIKIINDTDLHIQNKPIHYQHDVDTGMWSSSFLPYTQYSSLIELAQSIVKDTLEFSTTEASN